MRARWSKIYTGTPQLRTAFAWESLLDEVVFISGPPLATLLALQIAPSAALLVATLVPHRRLLVADPAAFDAADAQRDPVELGSRLCASCFPACSG